MVRVSETTVAKYCYFCSMQGEEAFGSELQKERRERKALYSCTLCGRDLCPKHVYFVSLPRELEERGESDFARYLKYTMHPDYGDGRICPQCAEMSLGRIAALLLEQLKRKFELERAGR